MNLSRFNVLDRHQSVLRHSILEASAGTGKTFTIENILLRLLIENMALPLEKILVVTFTRAATRDLKQRIRTTLEKALTALKQPVNENLPDFLIALFEQGEEVVFKARKRIEQAILNFGNAQIFTIHGFCWRMLKTYALEGSLSLETLSNEEENLRKSQLLQIVHDFLRTQLHQDDYSPQQLSIVLKKVGNIDKLQQNLLHTVANTGDILPSPTFKDLFERFQIAMQQLQNRGPFESAKIIEDFHVYAPSYKELFSSSTKSIHAVLIQKLQRFAGMFDKASWGVEDFDLLLEDGVFYVEAFDASKLKAKKMPPAAEVLHYPQFMALLKQVLEPVVREGRSWVGIWGRMVCDCQQFLRNYLTQEEMLGHHELLLRMREAIKIPLFARQVRQSYQAVIVDEFQDTDPIQWEIFSELFIPVKQAWEGCLHLVGDPKQSIYAFRQADIYTYLAAAEQLGESSRATLDTNFRSQPKLIEALNALFKAAPELFPLPKLANTLSYRDVKAGKSENKHFRDGNSCVQFWAVVDQGKQKNVEEKFFFPEIAKELSHLNTIEGLRFRECAILVADRYQSKRLETYLKSCGIPVRSQRGVNLSTSNAVHVMRDILKGMLHYRSLSSLKVALSNRMIGMNHAQILMLEDESQRLKIVKQCHHLNRQLVNEGFVQFYTTFMQSRWHGSENSILESLLMQKDGLDFYREWQDVADLLIEEESARKLSPEGLIAFLDEFELLAIDEDERLKASLDADEDGVSLLTTHISKGLEFDVIFTLGLIKRPKAPGGLIPVQEGSKQYLVGIDDEKDPRYVKHCEEIDSEKMRQLYVAMTRAKYRVYIPCVMNHETDSVDAGCASPMDLFIARLGLPSTTYEGLYARINAGDFSSFNTFISACQQDISMKYLTESAETTDFSKSTSKITLTPPPEVSIPRIPLYIQSFSSLTQHSEENISMELPVSSAPHDFKIALKNAHTLPSGSDTGTLLHRILEEIPFECVNKVNQPNDLLPWIQPITHGTPFESWDEVLAKIVYQSLTAPLKDGDRTFCLGDIDPKRVYRETEFLFPCDSLYCSIKQFEGTTLRPGYLKGVIDLFFEHEGRYYLLDWKSNWLGDSQDDYQQSHLVKSMQENGYGLQASIYVEALQRYLSHFIDGSFEEYFGGIYYLYLRGVGEETGVLHLPAGELTCLV